MKCNNLQKTTIIGSQATIVRMLNAVLENAGRTERVSVTDSPEEILGKISPSGEKMSLCYTDFLDKKAIKEGSLTSVKMKFIADLKEYCINEEWDEIGNDRVEDVLIHTEGAYAYRIDGEIISKDEEPKNIVNLPARNLYIENIDMDGDNYRIHTVETYGENVPIVLDWCWFYQVLDCYNVDYIFDVFADESVVPIEDILENLEKICDTYGSKSIEALAALVNLFKDDLRIEDFTRHIRTQVYLKNIYNIKEDIEIEVDGGKVENVISGFDKLIKIDAHTYKPLKDDYINRLMSDSLKEV